MISSKSDEKLQKRKRIERFFLFKKEFFTYFSLNFGYSIDSKYKKYKWKMNVLDQTNAIELSDKSCKFKLGERSGGIEFKLLTSAEFDKKETIKLSYYIFDMLFSFVKLKSIDCLLFHNTREVYIKGKYGNHIKATGENSNHLLSLLKKINLYKKEGIKIGKKYLLEFKLCLKEQKINIYNKSYGHLNGEKNKISKSFTILKISEVSTFNRNVIEGVTSCKYLFNETMKYISNIDPTSYYCDYDGKIYCKNQSFYIEIKPYFSKNTFSIGVFFENEHLEIFKTVKEAKTYILGKIKKIINYSTNEEIYASTYVNKLFNDTLTKHRYQREKIFFGGKPYYEFTLRKTNDEIEEIAKKIIDSKKINLTYKLRKKFKKYIESKYNKYIAFQVENYVILHRTKDATDIQHKQYAIILTIEEYLPWVEKENNRLKLLSLFKKTSQ